MSLIIGIESSCDETAAAVVKDGNEVLSNCVASQIRQHAEHGGVVPELAAREHLKALHPVLSQALQQAGVGFNELDAIAVTSGPGLMPALLVGLSFAKGLAAGNNLPLIGINHCIAHVYAAFLNDNYAALMSASSYPLLALVVSGGHTILLLIEQSGKASVVGSTIDDAAGEALDKAAKMLGLGYPGGPIIQSTAVGGDSQKYHFPRSLTGSAGKALAPAHRFNFSFSGVKTALLYHIRNHTENGITLQQQHLRDTAAAFQEAIIDVLCRKTIDAVEYFKAKSLVVCGGVACNTVLRDRMQQDLPSSAALHLAERQYCGDNAAMVAGMARHHLLRGEFMRPDGDAFSRLPPITHIPFTPKTT